MRLSISFWEEKFISAAYFICIGYLFLFGIHRLVFSWIPMYICFRSHFLCNRTFLLENIGWAA